MTYAGVELGGTKCVAILASGPADVMARETIPTTNPEETLRRIEHVLAGWTDVEALGIGSFGPIDLDSDSASWGRLLETPKPGWAGADIGRRLRDCLDVPTALDTDVNGAALAEMRWGAGRGMDDFAYVTVGTGIGVGLVANGRPMRGFGHCELGHVRLVRFPGDAWPGSCPYHGDCAEGLASGSSLKARLCEEVRPEDPVWESVAWTLAQLCHVIVCASAPRRIAIGGGVMQQHPHLLEKIRANLEKSLGRFLALPAGDFLCEPGLGADAGPLGAIALAMSAGP